MSIPRRRRRPVPAAGVRPFAPGGIRAAASALAEPRERPPGPAARPARACSRPWAGVIPCSGPVADASLPYLLQHRPLGCGAGRLGVGLVRNTARWRRTGRPDPMEATHPGTARAGVRQRGRAGRGARRAVAPTGGEVAGTGPRTAARPEPYLLSTPRTGSAESVLTPAPHPGNTPHLQLSGRRAALQRRRASRRRGSGMESRARSIAAATVAARRPRPQRRVLRLPAITPRSAGPRRWWTACGDRPRYRVGWRRGRAGRGPARPAVCYNRAWPASVGRMGVWLWGRTDWCRTRGCSMPCVPTGNSP